MKYRLLPIIVLVIFFFSCSTSRQIEKSARENVLNDDALKTAHVGISVFEPATGKYWYNYQGDKYFVPASNTKLPTCYAVMKYLGDSLVGLKVSEYENHLFLFGNGDPTFLHVDYKSHPVFDFLKTLDKSNKSVFLGSGAWQDLALGSGWAWNDYDADYMAERSIFPIYGNVVTFSGKAGNIEVSPNYFHSYVDQFSTPGSFLSRVERLHFANQFKTFAYGAAARSVQVPFITSDTLLFRLLRDTLQIKKDFALPGSPPPVMGGIERLIRKYVIHSQPTDSLLKPMMHRSDNFFAEQSLLMVSNELLDVMNDAKIIDTLLKTDFRDLPQKPRWVDGSGLSRYNLFTPQDFVFILNKMKSDFGMDRIKNILPTGNEGTLAGRFKADSNFIFAKTGTLSGVVSLSGFLYTTKNRLLIFSVLVNNQNGSATPIRRAVEKFIEGLRSKY
jgi:serine-type D-Ala-D-Ala carboxypeptidase/endopeptidase (penicillin-binding protein 4)